MLKIRVMHTLLWRCVGLVRGVGFGDYRRVGAILPAIRSCNEAQADGVILLDIAATPEALPPDAEAVEEFASECFVPMIVGGGVKTLEDVEDLLGAGADAVLINSAAHESPALVGEAARRFGSRRITAGIDARRAAGGGHECAVRGGTHRTGQEAGAWARRMEEAGAGEILLTSIDRDGTMLGYDLDLIRRVASCVGIPVVSSGGAGRYEHFLEAVSAGSSAVAAASLFRLSAWNPREAKRFLAGSGVPVRNVNAKFQSLRSA